MAHRSVRVGTNTGAPALEFSEFLEVTEAKTLYSRKSCTTPTRSIPVAFAFKWKIAGKVYFHTVIASVCVIYVFILALEVSTLLEVTEIVPMNVHARSTYFGF